MVSTFPSHVPRPDWEFIGSKDYSRALWVREGDTGAGTGDLIHIQ